MALYLTPQEAGGCGGCRFFLMCKGQCPGTAIDGDWRNRTERCETWKRLFETIEAELVASGKSPISLSDARGAIEAAMFHAWQHGRKSTISSIQKSLGGDGYGPPPRPTSINVPSERLQKDGNAVPQRGSSEVSPIDYPDALDFRLRPFTRLAWASAAARAKWEPSFNQVRSLIAKSEIMSVRHCQKLAAIISLPAANVQETITFCKNQDLIAVRIDHCMDHQMMSMYGIGDLPFLSHSVIAVARPKGMNEFLQAWRYRDHFELTKLLAYPSCCRTSFLENLERADPVWAAAVDDCASADSRVRGIVATRIG